MIDLLRRRMMHSINQRIKYNGPTLNLTNIGNEVTHISFTANGTFSSQLYCKKESDNLYKKWKYDAVELYPNETLMIWGDSATFSTSNVNYGQFEITGSEVKAHGTIKALSTVTYGSYLYYKLFYRCTSLVKIDAGLFNEVIWKGISNNYWFSYMFSETGLTKIPEHLFDGLSNDTNKYAHVGAFAYMFANCTRLENVPKELLKKQTFACQQDYRCMFSGCTSLKTAPDIYTIKAHWMTCLGMFSGCTSLENPPEIMTEEAIGTQSFSDMFSGCTSLKTAPKLKFTINNEWGQIYRMFLNCGNINEIHCKFTTWNYIDSSNVTSYFATDWLTGCADTGTIFCPQALIDAIDGYYDKKGTFVKGPGRGKYTVPANWTMIANDTTE